MDVPASSRKRCRLEHPLNIAEIDQTNSQALHSVFDFRRSEGNQFGCARFGKRAARGLQFGAGIAGMAHQFGDSGPYGSEEFAQRSHVQESGVDQAAKGVGEDDAGRAQSLSEWPGQGSHAIRYDGAVPFGQEGPARPPKQRQRRLEIFGGTADAAYAKLARDLDHQGRDLRQHVHVEVAVEVRRGHTGVKDLDNLSAKFGANVFQTYAPPEERDAQAYGVQVELAALVDKRGDQGGV